MAILISIYRMSNNSRCNAHVQIKRIKLDREVMYHFANFIKVIKELIKQMSAQKVSTNNEVCYFAYRY